MHFIVLLGILSILITNIVGNILITPTYMKITLPQTMYLLALLLITTTGSLIAQVGIGTTSPAPSSILDIDNGSGDKGVLLPRLNIDDFTTQSPVSGSVADWLLAFNTNTTSGTGFYYWDGSEWVTVGHNKFWGLRGNRNTDPVNNFLGTVDNSDMVFRTYDQERLRIDATGNVAIGNSTYSNAALRVNRTSMPYGIIAEASSTGAAVLGMDSGGGTALNGQSSGSGIGVFGYSANNHGMYATTAYTGGAFLTGGMLGWGTGNNNANGVLAITDKQVSSQSNIGIRAVSGSTTSISDAAAMNVGVNTNATDLGLYVMTEGPILTGSVYSNFEAARFQTNYRNQPNDSDSRDPRAQLAGFTNNSLVGSSQMYYGAYLYSGGSNSNSSYAYAGSRYNGTNYKIIGNGTVSTIVEGATPGDTKKVMFAPEAPEVLFEDYGTGTLVNGQANIEIDPIFAQNIVVDNRHPLKVFIQLEGDCKGVYVTNKSANGFSVRELQNGNANVNFSWHIVANRKDILDSSGEKSSNFSSLRFPDAPSELAPATQRKNNVDDRKEEYVYTSASFQRD